jgi:hypothetical protein
MSDYKFATHAVSTERQVSTEELSPVRLPLALVASLIKFHIGTPERVGHFTVCSCLYSPRIESPDVYSLALLQS